MTPRVSIILPTYNRATWLARALMSVQVQTIADWELVVINDGSTDHTAAVVARFAARDDRIRVITQENQGQAQATRVGVAASTAPLIAFLSDDDELTPMAMHVLADRLNDGETDGAYGDCQLIWRDAIFGGTAGQVEILRAGEPEELPRHNVVWGGMCRRAMYEAMGGYPSAWRVAHDYAFWLTAYANGALLAPVHVTTYVYTYHDGGNTFTQRSLQLREAAEIQRHYQEGTLGGHDDRSVN